VIVDFYEQVGYLPDAIINYLVLLGWSLDDKTEIFTRQQMIDNFDLARVTKAPASFDCKKLWSFQDHYMQQLPIKQKVAGVLPYLQRAGLVSSPPPCDIAGKLTHLLEAAGSRIKTLGDILDYADFFTADDQLAYDEQAFGERVRPADSLQLLTKYREQLATVETFEAEPLEKFTQEFVAAQGKKISDIVHTLRVALTGKPVGLGLFDTMEILGRDRTLERIDRAAKRAA
jgi:glutamyl-tRNA synthetase